MKIHDTGSTIIRPIGSSQGDEVRIYVCGATVYDFSHIGHARTFIIFDVLRRYLIQKGVKVLYVQNFTDVDDKIILKAKRLGIDPSDVSTKFIDQYFEDFDTLNVMRADRYPRATETMAEIISLIEALLKKNNAYVTKNGVYFDVSSFPEYGKLSKKHLAELQAGIRVDVDVSKKNPLDFALWKFTDDGLAWDSPWGKGRPGWHIECSAMVMNHLGETIDLHGGGEDLIFPHHENEIAQSESVTGKPLSRIWMHVGLVEINAEKMSKSLSNIMPLHESLARWGASVIRLYVLSSHYRSPMNYSLENMTKAEENWRLVESAGWELQSAIRGGAEPNSILNDVEKLAGEFDSALEDDMATHRAIGVLMRLARLINRTASEGQLEHSISKSIQVHFGRIMDILGLRLSQVSEEERKKIGQLIMRRNRLRGDGKFAEADAIRDSLRGQGFVIVDHPHQTTWIKLAGPQKRAD